MADVAVQTDVSGVDVFERFVKAHRTLVLEWLSESDHVAVTVYDDDTVAGGSGERRPRNERSPSSSSSAASSCSSPPRQTRDQPDSHSVADTPVTADGSPPAGRDGSPREWYPVANPMVATISEDSGGGNGGVDSGGGDEDDGSGGGSGHESIEMTHMTPATAAATATSPTANTSGPITTLKFHPFV